ncbi:MAG: class I SAM-dependent methyltransferase [Bacteroidia bacterium]
MQQYQFRLALRQFLHDRPGFRTLFYTLTEALVVSFWHMRQELWRLALSPNNRFLHVLDAGAGMGQYEHFMSSRFPGWNICALDREASEVAECNRYFLGRGKFKVYFKTANLETYREPGCYDLVLAVNVLEYVNHDRLVLTNFFDSLRSEGTLLLSVQSDKALKVEPNFTNKLLGNQGLAHRYNALSLKKTLKEIGFTQIRAHYAYGYTGRLSTRLGVRFPKFLLKQSGLWLAFLPFYFVFTYPIILLLNLLDVVFAHWQGSELVVRASKP